MWLGIASEELFSRSRLDQTPDLVSRPCASCPPRPVSPQSHRSAAIRNVTATMVSVYRGLHTNRPALAGRRSHRAQQPAADQVDKI
jgi:hypothetical protein